MTPKIYFKKYSQGNYFDGLDFIDSLEVLSIPADGFPVFDINTEQVGGVLQYTAGEFDIQLLIDQSETSANSDSIYDFFMGGSRNYKFLAVVWFGTYSPVNNNWKYFAGTFTNEEITFYYTSRRLSFRVKPMQNEVQAAMEKFFIGTLDFDRTLNQFLQILIPADINDYLSVVTSFFDYGTLIGDTSVKFKRLIWDSGAWVGTVDIWEQFMELMRGAGLSFKVRMYPENSVLTNFPEFIIYVFPLTASPAGADPLIIGDPESTTIFKNKQWLYYRQKTIDFQFFYSSIPGFADDGIITDGITNYESDELRPTVPGSPFNNWTAPGFLRDWGTTKGLVYVPETIYPAIILDYSVVNIIDLPTYTYTYPFQGYSPPVWTRGTQGEEIALIRCLNGTAYSFANVQRYAVNQYKRYVLGQKRIMKMNVIWDASHMYDVFETINVADEARTRTYYISRVQNIRFQAVNNSPPSAELTLIEL